MIPPRCFTCNTVVGQNFDKFVKQKNHSGQYGTLLDQLGIKRICCRRMLLTHVEITDEICHYSSVSRVIDDSKTTMDAFVKGCREVSCD